MKLTNLTVDVDSLEKGEWIESVSFDGVSWLVRGTEYPPYQKAMREALNKDARKHRRTRKVGIDNIERITTPLMVKHCLLDWKGLEDDAGNPIEYDAALADAFIQEKQYLLLRRDIIDAINEADLNLIDTREEISGN